MMLAYNILNAKTTGFYNWIYDAERLARALNEYREEYIRRKKYKNGYKTDIAKGTPYKLKKQFAAMERKIKNKPLFINEDIKRDYLSGIKILFERYYETIAFEQKPPKYDGLIWYDAGRIELHNFVQLVSDMRLAWYTYLKTGLKSYLRLAKGLESRVNNVCKCKADRKPIEEINLFKNYYLKDYE